MTRDIVSPVGIVVSRMTSERLPGKALVELGNRPLLGWVLESLAQCKGLSRVVVATSTESTDDPIADWCQRNRYLVFRGPLQDVLSRVIGAAESMGAESVVRISGDSPFIFPPIIDLLVGVFQQGGYEIVTNVFPRTFPRGQSVEVLGTDTLKAIREADSIAMQREHVTSSIYSEPSNWMVRNVTVDEVFPTYRDREALSQVSLCVDLPSDVTRLESFLSALSPALPWEADWSDFIRAIRVMSSPR